MAQVGRPADCEEYQIRRPEESFEARTMPVTETGCLLWTDGAATAGYGRVRVGGKDVYAHRYAWERANGPIPEGMHVDHKCHTPACCNIDHLRLATNAENSRNRSGAYANNTSGYRGVHWSRSTGKWRASLMLDGRTIHAGLFTDVEEAADAASAARKELYGEFAGRG